MKITAADEQHIPGIARLFDLYRQFYDCPADLELATNFIQQRLSKNESTIFVAIDDEEVLGFVQLYPSFCSVDAIKIYILYDLFVEGGHRDSGIGRKLMDQATVFARENGAERLDLLTEFTNYAGQHLYEKIGYKKVNQKFHAYSLEL